MKLRWVGGWWGWFTHRSFAAADDLTKFLAVAAALHGLLVRGESAATAQPFRREEKWRKMVAATGYYGNDHTGTEIDQSGAFLRCIQRTGERFFQEENTEAQPPTLSSGRAQPCRRRQHKGTSWRRSTSTRLCHRGSRFPWSPP